MTAEKKRILPGRKSIPCSVLLESRQAAGSARLVTKSAG